MEYPQKDSLKILIIASEVAPFAKVGGLADVVASLPPAFKDLGCDVAVYLPAYRQILDYLDNNYEVILRDLPVQIGSKLLNTDILKAELAPGIPLFLARQNFLFDRPEIYQGKYGEYTDNLERYIFFSRSLPLFCSAAHIAPDIILANDWHTGLVMPLLNQGAMPRSAGVFTIHNMGYLGLVPPNRIDSIGLPEEYYRTDGLEFYGQMSLLKAGIIYSQAVVTVSPTYAEEIQTPTFGAGLDGLMRWVKESLYGVLNGVDYQDWNPATDPHLTANYSPGNLYGKRLCKKDILIKMGISKEFHDKPLIGMVTRLVEQKGCHLVAEAADALFDLGLSLVVLGSGDKDYERLFSNLKKKYPKRFGLKLGYDSILARQIIAGSDMFLIPSLYEPCGLTQMYSLKYGTIPIVRATGGLSDTIIDPHEDLPATGFKFHQASVPELMKAVTRALQTFKKKTDWPIMQETGMKCDFSWEYSAKKYLTIFEKAISIRRGMSK